MWIVRQEFSFPICALWTITVSCAYNLQPLGDFSVSHPGFLSLIKSRDTGNVAEDYDLYVSSFSGAPFTVDHVYQISTIGRLVKDQFTSQQHHHVTTRTLATNIAWPNEINQVPDDVFGKRMFTIAGGFLVPGKTKGSIRLVDLSSGTPGQPIEITSSSTDDHEWFYHRVMWIDMNKDGRKDIVTCRAKKSFLGSGHGQLVWYEHPATDNMNSRWEHHVISDDADSFFDIREVQTPAGKFEAIVTAGFFSNKLLIHWTTDSTGSWADPKKVQSHIIDQSIGHVFDVQFADVNNDGHDDLLVTSNGLSNTGVYVYEVPHDFRTESFQRHTLVLGAFNIHTLLPGGGAPGSARTIKNPNNSSGKPLILLSGDDDGNAYILEPSTESASDWSYRNKSIMRAGGTIGEIASRDVDGDGHDEIFIPSYSHNKVYVYRLIPGDIKT